MVNPANHQVSRYSRNNNATSANIDFTNFIGCGTFKNAWGGVYTGGKRSGQLCVAKEFKTGPVFSGQPFQEEMTVIHRAQKIIDRFHAAKIIGPATIRLNVSEIWLDPLTGHRVMIEPQLPPGLFQKFNSNDGRVFGSHGSSGIQALQALSHFSYHDSDGRYLLCDLQGARCDEG